MLLLTLVSTLHRMSTAASCCIRSTTALVHLLCSVSTTNQCLLCCAEATHHQKASHQEQHEEQEPSKVMQAQAQPPQQARDPRNRPVALETPKDQYNKHLEAARTRSGPLSHKQPSPRHTSPANGDLIFSSQLLCHLLSSAKERPVCPLYSHRLVWCCAGHEKYLASCLSECQFVHPV